MSQAEPLPGAVQQRYKQFPILICAVRHGSDGVSMEDSEHESEVSERTESERENSYEVHILAKFNLWFKCVTVRLKC